jgi:hypothetical protein
MANNFPKTCKNSWGLALLEKKKMHKFLLLVFLLTQSHFNSTKFRREVLFFSTAKTSSKGFVLHQTDLSLFLALIEKHFEHFSTFYHCVYTRTVCCAHDGNGGNLTLVGNFGD